MCRNKALSAKWTKPQALFHVWPQQASLSPNTKGDELERSQIVMFSSKGIFRHIKVYGGIGPWLAGLYVGCSSCPLPVCKRFDTVTLLPSTNFKPGTIKKGGETVLWLTQQRAYSFGWALLHNSDQQRRKTHNTQGVWLTVHPITLWVANIKARCLHVAWQDVPPLVLKTKSWFSPSRAGFALYRARGQEKEITRPKHISDSVLKNIDITFLFSGAGNGQRK